MKAVKRKPRKFEVTLRRDVQQIFTDVVDGEGRSIAERVAVALGIQFKEQP